MCAFVRHALATCMFCWTNRALDDNQIPGIYSITAVTQKSLAMGSVFGSHAVFSVVVCCAVMLLRNGASVC